MNYKDLEKNIRFQLNEHEVKMDTDKLVADLFGKKKRKPFPMWILALAFAILATAGFVYLKWNDKTNNEQLQIPEVKDSLASSDLNDTKTNRKNEAVNEALIQVSAINSNQIETNIVNTGSNNFSSELNSNSIKSAKNQSEFVGKNYKMSDSGLTSNVKGDKNENSVYGRSMVTDSKNTSVDLISSEKNPSQKIADYKYIKIIPSKTLPAVSEEAPENQKQLPGVKCPSFKRKKQWSFSLIPEVGVFYPMTTFENNSNPNSEVLDIRKQNETTLEGLQAAIYAKVSQKSKPWYLKGGLNYGRITRKMTFHGSYVRRDTTIGIISITESQNGDTLTVVRGPIVTETNVTRKEVRHYFHHLWSVPLVVGYQQRFEKFEWGAEAGVNFNFRSGQSGYVMTAPDEFGYVKNTNLYRNSLGISYLAQVHIGIPVNENNVFALALRANINPNNFANSGTSLNEKYQMIGAHLMYELRF